MISTILSGGILMIPIILASIVGCAIIIERYRTFRKTRTDIIDFSSKAIEAIKSGRKDIGISLTESKHKNILAPILRETIVNSMLPKLELEKRVSETAALQISLLEKNMNTLATISSVSPLLGLLGTVTGMIGSFGQIAAVGVGKPELLANGISQALVTTAAGLFVAIPTMIFYNYLNSKIDEIIVEIEKNTKLFIEFSIERYNKNEAAA